MTRILRVPPAATLAAFAVLVGFIAALAGIYLLTGLAVVLVVGGVAMVVIGLTVDV